MSGRPRPARSEPVRVARIISRLNVGGPAIQAITLTKVLEPLGYRTTLLRGCEGPQEGSMDYLADELGVRSTLVPDLRRDPGLHDVRALPALVRACRKVRPQIVHTHTAKAGALGRAAALIGFLRPRPVLVHTFHGHSLSGYFSSLTSAAYLRVERFLARRTARLVAVSQQVREDLVALGVAAPEQIEVIPLGFDLSPFLVSSDERAVRRAALRRELDIPPDARVVTLIARLVPIKRVDRFLRMARMLDHEERVRFLVVGDGELRDELRASSDAAALGERLVWAGLRRDMPDVCFGSDVVVLTSDHEGTPVSLIEAQAAGLPVVSTAAGGVSSVVVDGETGWLASLGDDHGLAERVQAVLADDSLAARMGEHGRRRVTGAFSLDRLIADLDALYRRLLTVAGD